MWVFVAEADKKSRDCPSPRRALHKSYNIRE